jgi:hypothetical protein
LTQSTTLRVLWREKRGLFFCGILSSALKLIVRPGIEIDHLLIISEVK